MIDLRSAWQVSGFFVNRMFPDFLLMAGIWLFSIPIWLYHLVMAFAYKDPAVKVRWSGWLTPSCVLASAAGQPRKVHTQGGRMMSHEVGETDHLSFCSAWDSNIIGLVLIEFSFESHHPSHMSHAGHLVSNNHRALGPRSGMLFFPSPAYVLLPAHGCLSPNCREVHQSSPMLERLSSSHSVYLHHMAPLPITCDWQT